MSSPGPPQMIVAAAAAVHDVVAGAGEDRVAAVAAVDVVVAGEPADHVVAADAEDDVVAVGAEDDVGAVGADEPMRIVGLGVDVDPLLDLGVVARVAAGLVVRDRLRDRVERLVDAARPDGTDDGEHR